MTENAFFVGTNNTTDVNIANYYFTGYKSRSAYNLQDCMQKKKGIVGP